MELQFNTTVHVLSDPSAPPSDYTDLTWTNVAIGLAFIFFDVGISTILRLGIGISLLVAAVRCIGQLAVVATVLQGVFEHKNPWSVAAIACKSDC
jgi:ABC-type iron transport system FetAB permease component